MGPQRRRENDVDNTTTKNRDVNVDKNEAVEEHGVKRGRGSSNFLQETRDLSVKLCENEGVEEGVKTGRGSLDAVQESLPKISNVTELFSGDECSFRGHIISKYYDERKGYFNYCVMDEESNVITLHVPAQLSNLYKDMNVFNEYDLAVSVELQTDDFNTVGCKHKLTALSECPVHISNSFKYENTGDELSTYHDSSDLYLHKVVGRIINRRDFNMKSGHTLLDLSLQLKNEVINAVFYQTDNLPPCANGEIICVGGLRKGVFKDGFPARKEITLRTTCFFSTNACYLFHVGEKVDTQQNVPFSHIAHHKVTLRNLTDDLENIRYQDSYEVNGELIFHHGNTYHFVDGSFAANGKLLRLTISSNETLKINHYYTVRGQLAWHGELLSLNTSSVEELEQGEAYDKDCGYIPIHKETA